MSEPAVIKSLDKLTPEMRKRVEKLLALHPEIFLTETYRTKERQDYLYSLGRTRPGKIVTWVKHSNHQDGIAIDIAFHGAQLYPTDKKVWQKVGDDAEKLGLNWGYAIWGIDKPHFQISNSPPLDYEPSPWAAGSWQKAFKKGVVTKDPQGELDNIAQEIIWQRLGRVTKLEGRMSRERFIYILDKAGLI